MPTVLNNLTPMNDNKRTFRAKDTFCFALQFNFIT